MSRPRSTDLWREEYPFRSHHAQIAGERLHYVDEGQGPVLLCVHGNPTWSFYWRRLVLGLRDRFRLVVPDHLGCGLSERSGRRFRLADRVAHLAELIRALNLQQVTLVGHDWGGAIGVGALLAERARFVRLVLMNTAAFRSTRMPWRIGVCRTPLLGRIAVQGANGFLRAALRMALVERQRITPAVRAGYLAPYGSWAERHAIYDFVADIPLRLSHPSYDTLAEIEAQLCELRTIPRLLLWGLQDWCFTPHFLDRFLQVWPDAEVERYPQAGHWLMEDAWEFVVPRVRRFLTTHPAFPVDTPATGS